MKPNCPQSFSIVPRNVRLGSMSRHSKLSQLSRSLHVSLESFEAVDRSSSLMLPYPDRPDLDFSLWRRGFPGFPGSGCSGRTWVASLLDRPGWAASTWKRTRAPRRGNSPRHLEGMSRTSSSVSSTSTKPYVSFTNFTCFVQIEFLEWAESWVLAMVAHALLTSVECFARGIPSN